jgi:Domain of unknown function (DUF1707)
VFVGDRDRELAATALRRHFAHGRLSVAELSDRVELTLRARSRDELDAALRGLPKLWEDLPGITVTTARRLQRGIRRARFLFVCIRAWSKISLGLVLACGIALVAGAPLSIVIGAFLIGWVLASFATLRAWRRAASRP